MSRIFISYKRVDKDKVFNIKDQIEAALGEKCWIDLDGIESDAQFMNVIIKAIRECEVLLFMYSKTHAQITDFEKDWTVRELNFASKKEKRIVFVNIDRSALSDEFEFMYGTKQQVDAMSDNAMSKLLMDLRSWLNIHVPDNSKLSHQQIQPFSKEMVFPVGNVEFKMIHVEGGTFTMGATSEMEDPYDDEKPAHQVTLSSYYISETPVTQELWKEVMGFNPSCHEGDQNPVDHVSWDDCQGFIKELNRRTGRKFRMPTEAEWEYAGRGGNKSRHTQYSGSDNLDEVAWYEDNSEGKTHRVKQKEPNELGIYDMTGNVWEWCHDWYGDYNKSAQTNPIGPSSGSCRVERGGGLFNDAWCCRLSYRLEDSPDNCSYDIGLRLALSE